MISIRDVVVSRAEKLPHLYIKEEEIPSLFGERLVFESAKIGGSIYYRYPLLFGPDSPLRNVWFEKRILGEVSNAFLYTLEKKLSNPIDNFDIAEAIAPSDWEVLIKKATLPVDLVPAHLRDIGHLTAVRCG